MQDASTSYIEWSVLHNERHHVLYWMNCCSQCKMPSIEWSVPHNARCHVLNWMNCCSQWKTPRLILNELFLTLPDASSYIKWTVPHITRCLVLYWMNCCSQWKPPRLILNELFLTMQDATSYIEWTGLIYRTVEFELHPQSEGVLCEVVISSISIKTALCTCILNNKCSSFNEPIHT